MAGRSLGCEHARSTRRSRARRLHQPRPHGVEARVTLGQPQVLAAERNPGWRSRNKSKPAGATEEAADSPSPRWGSNRSGHLPRVSPSAAPWATIRRRSAPGTATSRLEMGVAEAGIRISRLILGECIGGSEVYVMPGRW